MWHCAVLFFCHLCRRSHEGVLVEQASTLVGLASDLAYPNGFLALLSFSKSGSTSMWTDYIFKRRGKKTEWSNSHSVWPSKLISVERKGFAAGLTVHPGYALLQFCTVFAPYYGYWNSSSNWFRPVCIRNPRRICKHKKVYTVETILECGSNDMQLIPHQIQLYTSVTWL